MSVPLALPSLFARALAAASKAFNQPTIQDSTQDLIQSSLKDLRTLDSRIVALSLFSPNESLEDISTRDLVYLLVPYVFAEVQGRVRTTEREERVLSLGQANRYLRAFLARVENYDEVIPEGEHALHERKASSIPDPARRRELKIKQYQMEKDLRARIEAIRKRRGQLSTYDDPPSDFDLISSLLPSPPSVSSSAIPEDDEDHSQTDDILRETTLLLLRLFYAQAHSHLESVDQELELLQNAPPPPSHSVHPDDDRRGKGRERGSDMWKLDAPPVSGVDGKGPLLDPSGRPLRPFTILPAGATDRARLQAQVFGPGHRLPTMAIDEYLQIERERGNIISGGGPASAAAPTSSEQLGLDAEMDGTREGEEKAETKRVKDENWARFTDENPKGAGNTMNRG